MDTELLEQAEDILAEAEKAILDNDPGYAEWLDKQAMIFDYSHARLPGE